MQSKEEQSHMHFNVQPKFEHGTYITLIMILFLFCFILKNNMTRTYDGRVSFYGSFSPALLSQNICHSRRRL